MKQLGHKASQVMGSLVAVMFVFTVMLVLAPSAHALCTGYIDGQANCTGANGCTGTYPTTRCSWGCTPGNCDSTGNSAYCCGFEHRYAQIHQWGECTDGECGLATRRRVISSLKPSEIVGPKIDLYQDYSPGNIILAANVSVRPPIYRYVYSRCTGTFHVVVEGN